METQIQDKTRMQEMFNKVWEHFLVNGGAVGIQETEGISRSECCYRGSNGQRCAIGVLLPDDLFLPEAWEAVNRLPLKALVDHYPSTQPYLRHKTGIGGFEFAQRLQSCHDITAVSTESPEEFRSTFRNRMEIIAESSELEVPSHGN